MADILNIHQNPNLEQVYFGLDGLINEGKALATYEGLDPYKLCIRTVELLSENIPDELRNKIFDFLAFFKDEFVLLIVESKEERSEQVSETIKQLLCWFISLWEEGPELLVTQLKISPAFRGAPDKRIEARIVTFRSVANIILNPGTLLELETAEKHNSNYIYLQELLSNMSYERQEVIGEFLSFELSPKPFEHLKDSLDDVRSKFVRLYLGELEIARMLNPILTIQLLNEFKDKILITQTEVIMAFLEDDIELSDNNENDVESENTDTEDEDAEEENEVTESDVMDFQHFYTIFLDIIHSINSETLERLKRQVGV